ncbi:MAG: CDP-alcohol phosphatidyltransferase family protein [Labilithrix sp.]
MRDAKPGQLEYQVQDRSILLPHYKRLFVEPTLRLIPARLSPNAITHAGHLLNLGALVWLMRGGSPIVSAVLLNAYLWADNADGAHARRTKQTSATGEFLDHGFDLLNATYVAIMTVIALGTPPIWSVAAAVVVPAAAAVTYWEQAETGTFQLGMFNQIESIACLTVILVARAVLGPLPPALGTALLGLTTLIALVGIGHSALRVVRRGGRLVPFVAPLAFGVAIALVTLTGALAMPATIAIGAAGFIFLGVRQLHLRIRKEKPVTEYSILVAAALLGAQALHVPMTYAFVGIFAILAFARTVTAWALLTRSVTQVH